MASMLWQIAQWLAELETAAFYLRPFGKLGRWLLRHQKLHVSTDGFEFFPNRETLVKAHGTLATRFADVKSVSAIWVVGQKFIHADEKSEVLKRLLLPHPEDHGFANYLKTGPHEDAGEMVKKITKVARSRRVDVRWYHGFISHSVILADVDKPNGWIHVESVFPYSLIDQRPSYTLYRRRSEQAVLEMQRIFQKIWDDAEEPPET